MVVGENQIDFVDALEFEIAEASGPAVAVSGDGEVVEGRVLSEIVAEILYSFSQDVIWNLRSVVRVGKPPTKRVKSFFFSDCDSSPVISDSQNSVDPGIRTGLGSEIVYFNYVSTPFGD